MGKQKYEEPLDIRYADNAQDLKPTVDEVEVKPLTSDDILDCKLVETLKAGVDMAMTQEKYGCIDLMLLLLVKYTNKELTFRDINIDETKYVRNSLAH